MQKVNEKYQRVGYGVVRDKHGKPKVDDPATLHPMHLIAMTKDEKVDLGIHPDCWARDAQGFKRLTKLSTNSYRAEESLVAFAEVFDVHTGDVWRIDQRFDAEAGTTINLET